MSNLHKDVEQLLSDIDLMSLNLEHKVRLVGDVYDACLLPYLDSIVMLISRAIAFCDVRIECDSKND